MSLMLVTVLKMAKQYFIRVYGTQGHLFVGHSSFLGARSQPGPIAGYGPELICYYSLAHCCTWNVYSASHGKRILTYNMAACTW